MKFTKIIAAAALSASLAIASLTAPQIASSIDSVTTLSRTLQITANAIQITDVALFPFGRGNFPVLIAGFTNITVTVTSAVRLISGTNPFSLQSDQDTIFNSFRAFVVVHQQLLNIVIGKAGILGRIPFVGPAVAQVLRTLEGVVDTFAFTLIGLCQARAQDLTFQKNSLDVTLQLTIKTYGG